MTTTTKRDGLLTINGGRLRFFPETYPVAHLANEGWRKESDGVWSAPATAEMARRVLRLFPALETDRGYDEWLGDLALASITNPGILAVQRPPRWNDLYPYQQRAAEWLAQKRSAMLCLSPGLGKSAVALTAAQMAFPHLPVEVVVIAPLTLLGVWERELKLWWPDAISRFRDEEPRALPNYWPPLITIVTYDYLRLHGLPRAKADLLIFDESVLLKNRAAKRTKAAAIARKQAKVCWLLSGSPTTRFYDDLWAQLHVLDPKTYSSYWRWISRYVLIADTIWGRQIVANVPGIEPTLKRDLVPILHTYNYTDLARDEPERAIPEWVFETRQVPLPAKWWRLYKQMQDRFVADLPDGNRVLAPNTLARLVRLLQLASHPALLAPSVEDIGGGDEGHDFLDTWEQYDWSTKGGKLSAVPDLLEELPGPTIVWTNFIATAQRLATILHAPCLIGETPADERTRVVADFQAGKYPVVIAHPGVGRFGLTLTKARSAIFVERNWAADNYLQALYRCRRIGTTEPPHIVILEATGPEGQPTVDRTVQRVLSYRKDKAETLTTALLREELT